MAKKGDLMRARGSRGGTIRAFGAILAIGLPLTAVSAVPNPAQSAESSGLLQHAMFSSAYGFNSRAPFVRPEPLVRQAFYPKRGSKGRRYGYGGGGLQCVPFARDASGIELTGNAWTWWDQAAGVYERGSTPEPGSILAFRANGAMQLGHVAVVSRVVNDREIEIDHANWGGYRGGVARGMPVVDVSPNNDWTAVRVGLGNSGEFGSIYPTNGFIYGRPDRGTTVIARTPATPRPELSPAPHDLRPAAEQADGEEVAEAPAPRHHRRGRQHAR